MSSRFYSVAIDGPAGAGKSTMARRAAKDLGFVYVDTGAIYRTVGYHMDFYGIGPRDTDGVTDEIRTPEMSEIASAISAQKVVRDYLLEMQRELARKHHVIMDGRDIGTVVLPKADVKIFLTASPEIRARRRFEELRARGETASFEKVLDDLKKRDERDSTRKLAPLRPAKDAVLLDTSELDVEQSAAAIESIVKEKLGIA